MATDSKEKMTAESKAKIATNSKKKIPIESKEKTSTERKEQISTDSKIKTSAYANMSEADRKLNNDLIESIHFIFFLIFGQVFPLFIYIFAIFF